MSKRKRYSGPFWKLDYARDETENHKRIINEAKNCILEWRKLGYSDDYHMIRTLNDSIMRREEEIEKLARL